MNVCEEHLDLLHAAYGERILTVEGLSGGLRGRCYRVRGADFDHAVRMPAPDEGGYRLTVLDEQRVLARAHTAGLAPPVVDIDASLGLVATEYLADARTWSPADAQRLENIDDIAARLKGLHACELELPSYACSAAAQTYVESVDRNQPLSAEQRGLRDDLLRLAHTFEARFAPETPCHNDLVASNVLDDGELWLIDFEYAVISAPILDLAGLAGFNEFNTAQRARLIGAYYGHGDVPFSADEFRDVIRLVCLLSYFWALAFAGPTKSKERFAAFADAMAAMLR